MAERLLCAVRAQSPGCGSTERPAALPSCTARSSSLANDATPGAPAPIGLSSDVSALVRISSGVTNASPVNDRQSRRYSSVAAAAAHASGPPAAASP